MGKIYRKLILAVTVIIVCEALSACSGDTVEYIDRESETVQQESFEIKETDDIYNMHTIYYVHRDRRSMYWLVEERTYKEMIRPEDMIRTLIEENYVASDMELLDFWMEGAIAYVDLSNVETDKNGYGYGDLGLCINLYTIVNNLCINEEFGIKGVRFLDNHVMKPTLGELLDNEEPFECTFELQRV